MYIYIYKYMCVCVCLSMCMHVHDIATQKDRNYSITIFEEIWLF